MSSMSFKKKLSLLGLTLSARAMIPMSIKKHFKSMGFLVASVMLPTNKMGTFPLTKIILSTKMAKRTRMVRSANNIIKLRIRKITIT